MEEQDQNNINQEGEEDQKDAQEENEGEGIDGLMDK